MRRSAIVAAVACLSLAGMASAVTVETVPVGNVGNAADPLTGYGRVDYDYRIGKYEVTTSQYVAFLNAVAATDTYELYSTNMSRADGCGGIRRDGESGSYRYSAIADYEDRPANYVSFWNACRFANWLTNGQPTGSQGPGTTESGTYTLTRDGMNHNTITRNPGAIWAVTSEDEWYKAAYYNPATSSYYLYPTSSNTVPGRDMADVSGNNANWHTTLYPVPIDGTCYTTRVGEFQNSDSPYGTFDQGGNVYEWNETILGSDREMRGGSFFEPWNCMRADERNDDIPMDMNPVIGFRVVQVPEPASMAILSFIGVGLLARRRAAGQ